MYAFALSPPSPLERMYFMDGPLQNNSGQLLLNETWGLPAHKVTYENPNQKPL